VGESDHKESGHRGIYAAKILMDFVLSLVRLGQQSPF
jgi:hypothetical protein